MKITHANVTHYASVIGLVPFQIDGIPEGFSYKEPDVSVGGEVKQGRIMIFHPMLEWDQIGAIEYREQPKPKKSILDHYLKDNE